MERKKQWSMMDRFFKDLADELRVIHRPEKQEILPHLKKRLYINGQPLKK